MTAVGEQEVSAPDVGTASNQAAIILGAYGALYSPKAKREILAMLSAKSTHAQRKRWWDDLVVIVTITKFALIAEHSTLSKTKRDSAQSLTKKFGTSILAAQTSLGLLKQDDEMLKYLAIMSGIYESNHQQKVGLDDSNEIYRQWCDDLVRAHDVLSEIGKRVETTLNRFSVSSSTLKAIGKVGDLLSPKAPKEWPPLRRAILWLGEVWKEARHKDPTTKSIIVGQDHKTEHVDDTEFNRFVIEALRPIAPSYKWSMTATGNRPRSYLADIRWVRKHRKINPGSSAE